jgi:hypothetical protein
MFKTERSIGVNWQIVKITILFCMCIPSFMGDAHAYI